MQCPERSPPESNPYGKECTKGRKKFDINRLFGEQRFPKKRTIPCNAPVASQLLSMQTFQVRWTLPFFEDTKA